MIVWMSTLRRGLSYHYRRPDEPKTVCGRFMGREGDERGHHLPVIRAVDDYAAKECPHCAGSFPVTKPPQVKSWRP